MNGTVEFPMEYRNTDEIKIVYCPHKWIKCSERYPDFDQHVLFSDGHYIDLGYRNKKDTLWCVAASMLKSMPTHWMPLPNPPEDEK